ncbi:major facilitator superfamily domain-containing protein [Papiliotrema laurentii]|uniref:Major facilitator superfamily domain-containing protein n=1 Tax=Papiliotrema laurentii TaxID=5418 RepID=A0AAD9L721_PAPLA|nr:major facilitator superfamily domain-containing protein [Papiliotrema laurentii]
MSAYKTSTPQPGIIRVPTNTSSHIPLSVPTDLAASGGMLDEIERQVSRRTISETRVPTLGGGGMAGLVMTRREDEKVEEGEGEGKGEGEGEGKAEGEGEGEGEEEEVPTQPKNNMFLVTSALMLITFVSALDSTIVVTALPTIAGDLQASHAEYSWIGTASHPSGTCSYLLGQTILTPINGRVSDITGRKPMLYTSTLFLMVFSALCGSAQNITWLIAARFFAGLGGGAIVSLSIIVISDLVPMADRAAYQGYMGASYAVAGVLGPIIGGVITSKSTWRWCFYLNLPTCGAALVALFFSLKLNRPKGHDLEQLRRSFDFVGLVSLMVGAALLIVGFANAADFGFGGPTSYAFIVSGGVVIIGAIVHSLTTTRNAIIPPRMLKNRTTLFFSLGSFMNSLIFMPVMFLLPQYFQGVRGLDSEKSGQAIIPFSVTISIGTIVAGQLTSRYHLTRPLIWTGFGLACIGYILFATLLNPHTGFATQLGIQVIASAGVGLAIQTPMMVIQAAMPFEDMAASMSAWILMRSVAAAVGVAVFSALLNSEMRTRFSRIDGFGTAFDVPKGVEGYQKLQHLPGPLKATVLDAFAQSFRLCWIVAAVLLAAALFLTLWTKNYALIDNSPSARSTTPHRAEETPRSRTILPTFLRRSPWGEKPTEG